MAGNWFIGLPFTARDLAAELGPAPIPLRRFNPDDLHITVAFLGPIDSERARAAWQQIILPQGGPIAVTLGRLTSFGRPRRPSAFAFEIDDGQHAVAELISAQGNHLRAVAGLKPERRLPRPHVTVARPPRQATPSQLAVASEWLATVKPQQGRFQLDRIALYTAAPDRRKQLFVIVEEQIIPPM